MTTQPITPANPATISRSAHQTPEDLPSPSAVDELAVAPTERLEDAGEVVDGVAAEPGGAVPLGISVGPTTALAGAGLEVITGGEMALSRVGTLKLASALRRVPLADVCSAVTRYIPADSVTSNVTSNVP